MGKLTLFCCNVFICFSPPPPRPLVVSACQGCKAQAQDTVLTCGGRCGQIMSRGFPYGYGPRERVLWTVTVDSGQYVTLTFEDFDVYERPLVDCLKDYVEVRDVDLIGGQRPIGR